MQIRTLGQTGEQNVPKMRSLLSPRKRNKKGGIPLKMRRPILRLSGEKVTAQRDRLKAECFRDNEGIPHQGRHLRFYAFRRRKTSSRIYSTLPEFWDFESNRLLRKNNHPFDFAGLYSADRAKDQHRFCDIPEPAGIIAGF